jgi:RNA polymerase primary sigma factor
LAKRIKEGQEKVAEEVLSSPTALRYVLALADEVRRGEPRQFQEITKPGEEIDREAFMKKAVTLRRLASTRDRILSKLKQAALPEARRERLEKNLQRVSTDILMALKTLRLSSARVYEIAATLKKAFGLLTELQKRAQTLSGKDRAAVLSEISAIERELELPAEEIKRRVRSIVESEAQVGSARNDLVDAHLRLVVKVARRYSRLGLPLLDLIQDGNLGLLRAASKFDPRGGLRFATYAWWWIRVFVRNGAIRWSRFIQVSRGIIDSWRKLSRTRRVLVQKLEREPTPTEIAAEMGEPVDEVLRIIDAMRKPISLELPMGEEGHLAQFVENRRVPQPIESAMLAEVRAHVAKALAGLPPREGEVLRARFGIDEGREETLQEVANKYSITRERVRQIEHRAFERLRSAAQRPSPA